MVRPAGEKRKNRRVRLYVRWIVGSSLTGFLIGFLVLLVVPPAYDAVAVVAAPIDHGGAKIRGDVSAGPSTSLLANLSLGSGSTSPLLQRFQQMVHSQRLADLLFSNDAIAHGVFEGQWDPKAQAWRQPSGIFASVRHGLYKFLDRPEGGNPTAWHLQAYLERHIVITSVPKNSSFELKYSCSDPDFCLRLLRAVLGSADALIRQDITSHDQSYTKFLDDHLKLVTDLTDRQTFISLLSDIRREEMLAGSGETYSIDIVDDPAVSPVPTEPKIGLTLALGLSAGFLLSVIGVVIFEALGIQGMMLRLRERPENESYV